MSPLRLYTALIGSQRVLTINASDVQEAREALSTLLGDVDALSIRHATADEALAWNASAMEAAASSMRSGESAGLSYGAVDNGAAAAQQLSNLT